MSVSAIDVLMPLALYIANFVFPEVSNKLNIACSSYKCSVSIFEA